MASPKQIIDGGKQCGSCDQWKPLEDFSTHPKGRGGRRSYCKACAVTRMSRWSKSNPERRKASKKSYWHKHGERLNAERRAARDDAVRRREREYRQAHPEQCRALNHRRRARLGRQSQEVTARIAELLKRPCFYCGATASIEIDHLVPLSRGGQHVVGNLVAACWTCNRSKQDRLPFEWGGWTT